MKQGLSCADAVDCKENRWPPRCANTRGPGRLVGVDMTNRTCSVEGCNNKHRARGLCSGHYGRLSRTGSVDAPTLWTLVTAVAAIPVVHGAPCLPPRVWRRIVTSESGCWEWVGGKVHGYGMFRAYADDGSRLYFYTHRLTYLAFVGEIPAGLHMDHFRYPDDGCIGPACCHPHHVRPVTILENTLRGEAPTAWNRAKTHCYQGHPLSGPNLYRQPSGSRVCRTCRLESQRRRTSKRRVETITKPRRRR